jgi:hypothetical protein
MSAQIIDRTETAFTVQVTIPYNQSMLEFEEALQDRLNAAGVLATQEGLRQFDTGTVPPLPSARSHSRARGNTPRITRRHMA